MNVLAEHLPDPPQGRCIVVGAGKAAAAMAAALEAAWPNVDLSGVVVTQYGHAVPTRRIEVLEAAHPLPDENSLYAARRALETVGGLRENDLVLALVSGGGSSLLALPADGLTLDDKQAVNRALLASGATIHEMNAVRKHLSAIKGGRLAAAARPAKVVTLAISDVPGNDPPVIASGPTVGDPSTLEDVREILRRYELELPPAVAAYLEKAEETPKPADLEVDFRIIASPFDALIAAANAAEARGFVPVVLGELEGESRELGIAMAGIARAVRQHGMPVAAPAVLLSGGETTVTIGKGPAGRGGRNMEFLLSLAIALDGAEGVWSIAGDTDGRDGTEDAAGAIVAPDTLVRARTAGMNPRNALAAHDSYSIFERIGDLLCTGPTLTNVNALRAVVVV
jgi:glycerate 2-kinase